MAGAGIMPSRLLTDLDIRLQPWAGRLVIDSAAIGYKIIIDCTYRSNAEQDADYAQGRTAPGAIITHARAGESAHNCTLPDGTPAARGFDIAVYSAGGLVLDWDAADIAWKSVLNIGRNYKNVDGSPTLQLGADWPLDVRDNPHLELFNWASLSPPVLS